MDPITVYLSMVALGAIGKTFFESNAAQQKEHSIDLYAKQQQLQYLQKTEQNQDLLSRVISRQTAQLSTRGVGMNSPSFNAIQVDTVNQAAKAKKNLDTEKTFMDINNDIEKENVQNTFYAQLFGNAVNTATTFADVKSRNWGSK